MQVYGHKCCDNFLRDFSFKRIIANVIVKVTIHIQNRIRKWNFFFICMSNQVKWSQNRMEQLEWKIIIKIDLSQSVAARRIATTLRRWTKNEKEAIKSYENDAKHLLTVHKWKKSLDVGQRTNNNEWKK